jgi:hypothetical protein
VPPGYAVHDITSRAVNADEARRRAVGVVIVEFDATSSPGSGGQLEYVVYSSDADAQADFDASKTRPVLGGTVLGNFNPTELPTSAVCQQGTRAANRPNGGTDPAAGCMLRSANTVILSSASRQADNAAIREDAQTFARDAIVHLQRVQSGR